MDKRALVYKSNSLIEGHYKLSAAAQKIAASLISRVNPHGNEPLPTFQLTIRELAELCSLNEKKLFVSLPNYTSELKSIVIHLIKPDNQGYRQLGLFREFDFNYKTRKLNIEFEERLEHHIRDFAGNFTRYQLVQLQHLKSRYSVRLYEILRKARNIETLNSTVKVLPIELEHLRKMMGSNTHYYSRRFDAFRTRVLNVAQTEINEKTDLKFTFQPVRKGRKVDSIKFFISHNVGNSEGQHTQENSVTEEILKLVNRLKLDKVVLPVLASFSSDIARESLLEVSLSIAAGEIETTPEKYLLGILKNKTAEQEPASQKRSQPTIEELTDRSWIGKYDFDFDE